MAKRTPKPAPVPKIDATMPLLTFGRENYMAAARHNGKKLSGKAVLYKVSQLCGELATILGRVPVVADLTLDVFNRFKSHLEPMYAKNMAAYFCGLFKALLRYAGELKLVEIPDELLPQSFLPLPYEPGGANSLWEICQKQFFPKRMQLQSDKTQCAYRLAINHFGRYLGHDPTLADLDDDIFTGWLKEQLQVCKSVYTVRERMGRVTCLWRWLASRRVVERFPTIIRPEAPEIVPIAMSQEQIRALFESCLQEPGKIGGVRAGWWWQAFLAFVWSSGERRTAALSLRWEWIDFQRMIVVIPARERKGRRKQAIYQLWPEALPLIERIRQPNRELVFPWDKCEGSYWYNFGRILERADLPNGRKYKTHGLRCSHATWLEVFGGDPTKSLKHSDRATTQKHYIDQRHLPQEGRRLFVPWEVEPDLVKIGLETSAEAAFL